MIHLRWALAEIINLTHYTQQSRECTHISEWISMTTTSLTPQCFDGVCLDWLQQMVLDCNHSDDDVIL